MAAGMRRIHSWNFAEGRYDCVYSFAAGTSSQAQFRGRVRCVFEETQCGLRSAVRVGIEVLGEFQACLRHAVPCVRVDPALETPGYSQTVPPGPAFRARRQERIRLKGASVAARGPGGTT